MSDKKTPTPEEFLKVLLSSLKQDIIIDYLEEKPEEMKYYSGLIEARDRLLVRHTLQEASDSATTVHDETLGEFRVNKQSVLSLEQKIVESLNS